jgi:hypothetical protein
MTLAAAREIGYPDPLRATASVWKIVDNQQKQSRLGLDRFCRWDRAQVRFSLQDEDMHQAGPPANLS